MTDDLVKRLHRVEGYLIDIGESESGYEVATVKEAADRIEELEKELAEANRQITELENELDNMENEICELENRDD